jgi:AcrR family transcriptional regulator
MSDTERTTARKRTTDAEAEAEATSTTPRAGKAAPRSKPAPSRRSQAERVADTRAKLMDAAIESLATLGYTAASTREISERAGLSRGAQTRHFPRRLDLIMSAVDEIAKRNIEQWSRELENLPPGKRRRRRALDLLWEYLTSTLAIASTKLWIVADEDPDLYQRMAPVERKIADDFREHAYELLGETKPSKDFDRRFNLAIHAMRGLALVYIFEPLDEDRPDPWPDQRGTIEALLWG